jgi:hypothetical protein
MVDWALANGGVIIRRVILIMTPRVIRERRFRVYEEAPRFRTCTRSRIINSTIVA